MNYRLRDKSVEKRSYRTKLLLMIALALFLVGALSITPGATSRISRLLALPFWNGGQAASDGVIVAEGLATSKRALIAENRELRADIEQARADLLAVQGLETENAELRRLLGIAQGRNFAYAAVLAKPPVSPYDTLVLEGGTDMDLKPGDLVYSGENVILGVITEAEARTSLAKLYSSAGMELIAAIDRTSVQHTVYGTGAGNFELKVPKGVDVAPGDLFVLPGAEKKILGTVRKIETNPADSFQKIYIKTPVNIFQLKWVGVERLSR